VVLNSLEIVEFTIGPAIWYCVFFGACCCSVCRKRRYSARVSSLSYNLDALSTPSPTHADAANSWRSTSRVNPSDLATVRHARVLEAVLVGVKSNNDFAFAPEPLVDDAVLREFEAFMSATLIDDQEVSRWAQKHSGLLPQLLNRWATTTRLLPSMVTYSAKVDDHGCFPSLNSIIAYWGNDDKRRLKAVFQILKEVQTRTNTDVHVIADLVSGSFTQTPASASNSNAKWACIVLIENADKIGVVGTAAAGEEKPAPVMQYYDDDGSSSSSSSGPGEKKDDKLAEHVIQVDVDNKNDSKASKEEASASESGEKKDEKPAEHVIQVDVDNKNDSKTSVEDSEPKEKTDEKAAEHVIQVDDKASASESASESDDASEKKPSGV
jgi:hypothetical protein